ncbi:hypothetical protein SUGI_1522690 [Cryptomeria japonica]|uniref:Uncharacterized protein n=1 Tax=Cryptomeria japonica TaxID=3369 RepID=A0AAD3NW44_CRYJA|nr:hypothetical protein SUGI_1522690 [Cryptomeria japonica]
MPLSLLAIESVRPSSFPLDRDWIHPRPLSSRFFSTRDVDSVDSFPPIPGEEKDKGTMKNEMNYMDENPTPTS